MLAIKMRGELQATTVPGEFLDTLQAIQMARSKGQDFLILEKEDGNGLGFFINNLNSIEEIDDAF